MKIFGLELPDDHYYIKRGHIVAKIPFGNRTLYAKFEKVSEPLTQTVVDQHIARHHIIAAPLIQNDKTNYLLIEYKGEEHQKFFHLVKHLMKTKQIPDYQIYQGRNVNKIQLFIKVNQITVEDAEEKLEMLSSILEQKLPKQWKCLPSSSLPCEYNIVTLPYLNLLSR